MSKHISRNERWKATEMTEEFESEDGVVRKDRLGNPNHWVGLVRDGSGLVLVGRDFKRARNAMIAVEEAAIRVKRRRF